MDAALVAIAHGGLSQVNIDALKRELGVSRGSFYWHFKNRDELVERSLSRWHERDTVDVIDQLRKSDDRRIRLRRLFIAAYEDRDSGMLYAALVASTNDPVVAKWVERTTRYRLDFLESTYCELGNEPLEARQNALMAYSLYTGLYDVLRSLPDAGRGDYDDPALRAYLEEVCCRLIPGWPTGDGDP
jgi:AcrR family transcriptional regulator